MKLKMKNTILTEDTELLDETGQVLSPGFARRPLWNYDRSRIHAPGFRIKEWDYYLVMTDEFAAAFTIAIWDIFAWRPSVSWILKKAQTIRELS